MSNRESHGDKLWYVEPTEPRRTAYLWSAKYLAEAEGLKEAFRLYTFHTWAYYGFFKPTIGEVLAQLQHRFNEGYRWHAFTTIMHLDGLEANIDDTHHIGTSIVYWKS